MVEKWKRRGEWFDADHGIECRICHELVMQSCCGGNSRKKNDEKENKLKLD
jgi:hypothetical protein